eukprot:CAMPEP_0202726074 /NCGR_PEP_ID=MMETSP1385-20130828/184426_1 /ASSEMBLY_ACC=CAM_ASM_000861 /TAXON_ID=933848 /ORGANISM="Elphidium margaritaceum" /LENGTH=769 /DNA_ID=CAMNT_0049392287 /DNA_START=25 /DNA_END=2335 /DNA_ORIENTATION=-
MTSTERNCPICERKMDDTDIQFTPCQCGYQMCAFCYNRICLAESPQCPNCRARYDEQHISASDPHHSHSLHHNHNHHHHNSGCAHSTHSNASSASNTATNLKSKKTNNKSKKSSSSSTTTSTSTTSSSSNSNSSSNSGSNSSNGSHSNSGGGGGEVHHSQLSYEQLSSIRVRQRNLVYAVNLPLASCDETTLKTSKWFGRFGKIKKVYCYKQTAHAQRTGSFAAFITFYDEKEAMKAIVDMNHKVLDDGRMLKATTGSTKYCSYFLRGASCSNPNCLYLHDWANKEDVVTKEELNDFGSPPYYSHHAHGAHGQPLRLNFDEKSDETEHAHGHGGAGGGGYADEDDASFTSSRARSASYHDATKNANVIRTVLATSTKPKSATATKISKFDYREWSRKVSSMNNNSNTRNHSRQQWQQRQQQQRQQQHEQQQQHPQSQSTAVATAATAATAAATAATATAIVTTAAAANAVVNTDSGEFPEFPPLSSGGSGGVLSSVSAHTTPVRPQKHRTKPPISHPQHSRSVRRQPQTAAPASQTSDDAVPSEQQAQQQQDLRLRHSKSANLSGKNGKDVQAHEQPPKISLDDTQTHTVRARQAAAMARNKSVNFEQEVDIVSGAHTKLHIESKSALTNAMAMASSARPRSKSSDAKKAQKHHGTTTHSRHTEPTSRSAQAASQSQTESHGAVARLLLRELQLLKNRDAMQRDLQQPCDDKMIMSDLLKDGMWSIDELVMDQYHYCYFLQSDRVIFEQFHEQYHHHYMKTQKLQKSKA